MKQKLTLSLNKDVIERAKYFAKHTQRSVSEIVEGYLDKITKETVKTEIPPELSKLFGAVKLPKDFDPEKARRRNMEEKFL